MKYPINSMKQKQKLNKLLYRILLCIGAGVLLCCCMANTNLPNVNRDTGTQSKSDSMTLHPVDNSYTKIDFDVLGDYNYSGVYSLRGNTVPPSSIPQNIRALNGKKVNIQGFYYPSEFGDNGKVKNFMLLRNQIICCFGDAVRINEWINVNSPEGVPANSNLMSHPVSVYGILTVGEFYQDGSLSNLYRMTADKVVEEKSAPSRSLIRSLLGL